MQFSARSALLVSSCLALGVHALPVTYSVVDVDGGAAAATPGSNPGPGASAHSSADQPATVYHTVTKSTEVEEPEATTVSVSITIVETKHAMPPKPTADSSSPSVASASSSPSPSQASAKAPATTPVPSTTDALSVLSSAQSTFMTSHISKPSPPAEPATNQSPSSSAAPKSSEDCEAASVTVTADVPDVKETTVPSQVHSNGGTVTLLSTTTVVSDAAPTSYYDDGMWHTRYAIKPSAAPEKPAADIEDSAPKVAIVFEAAGTKQPAPEAEDPVPEVDNSPAPAENEQPVPQTNQTISAVATNTTSKASNGTYLARRQVQPVKATPTLNEAAGTGVPEMLVHPVRPQSSGVAPHIEPNVVVARAAAPTGDVAAANPEVLSAEVDSTATGVAERAAPGGYSVVSWNETMAA